MSVASALPAGLEFRRHSFTAMGVSIECHVESPADCAGGFAAVEREFARLDRIFSRFRRDSDLSKLNRAGSCIVVSELVEVVTLALDARERTAGRFDPTVHDALVAAGYDRTFAELPRDGALGAPTGPCGGTVLVDRAVRTITLLPGSRLDLGGIVKGYAAERACDLLAPLGASLVSAGGDIALRGVPSAGHWPIAVETPNGPLTLGVPGGGVATSGRDFRRWFRGGRDQHHLIDPTTGLPSQSDLLAVTVVAADAIEAEIQAKALFLAGEQAAFEEARAARMPAVLRTADGRVVLAGGIA